MKVCFVGLGSIASRHIKNLKALYGNSVEIDVLRSKSGRSVADDIQEFVNKIYYAIEELQDSYDVIFITNPTKMHYDTLKKLKDQARNFFIEKPVFEFGNEDIDILNLKEDSVCYVACPLRFTNAIQYLKQNVDFDEVYSMRCISSSYLPDWRPGIDYRTTYSAQKELGGGVSIDLIHEWDYIYYLTGAPQKVHSFVSQKSNLEIDSDDIAVYIASYPDKTVELHLDYFGRVPIRKIELFTRDDSIEADLIEQKIIFKKEQKIIDLSENRDSYQQKELLHFFDIVQGKISNDNTIQDACRTLRTTRGETC